MRQKTFVKKKKGKKDPGFLPDQTEGEGKEKKTLSSYAVIRTDRGKRKGTTVTLLDLADHVRREITYRNEEEKE